MINKIREILSSTWLLHNDTVISYLPLALSILNGAKLDTIFGASDTELSRYEPYCVSAMNLVDQYDLSSADLPENSIAVIPIHGVLMKHSFNGTQRLISRIRAAEANENIIAIIFTVESPGGQLINIDIAGKAIKDCSKPTISYVTGMAASAAMWLISCSDKIIASSVLDQFGSIGVKSSFTNFNGFLETKLGAKCYEFYATKSTHKDFKYKELLDGNFNPIIADLDFANEIFHKTIQENLGINVDSPVFSGGMYSAEAAIENGLCHQIASFDYAVALAHKEGLKNAILKFNYK